MRGSARAIVIFLPSKRLDTPFQGPYPPTPGRLRGHFHQRRVLGSMGIRLSIRPIAWLLLVWFTSVTMAGQGLHALIDCNGLLACTEEHDLPEDSCSSIVSSCHDHAADDRAGTQQGGSTSVPDELRSSHGESHCHATCFLCQALVQTSLGLLGEQVEFALSVRREVRTSSLCFTPARSGSQLSARAPPLALLSL